jgi:glutamate--cysteine ligase
MSKPLEAGAPIGTRADLIGALEAGCKPAAQWRIGTEHEKFGFRTADLTPLEYDAPDGIAVILRALGERMGWNELIEDGRVIGLEDPVSGGNVSLEPGGQLELSGAPLENVHQTCSEVNTHLAHVRAVAQDLGVGFLGLGFSPKWTLAETPRMPKGRYDFMTAYMPKVGSRGLDMMYRTCTVQVNLDFSDEADMVKKLRVGLALQPVATAIFANSPFKESQPNGFLSYRAEVWRDTDRERTGLLPFAFEDGMGFERYVDYALSVPMYFVYRDGRYIDARRGCFADFLEGRLEVLPGERPTSADWLTHLSTLFPEARLKTYLEMRGADGGPWRRLCALPALWVGLLYDTGALDAAWDLVKDWSAEERQALRDTVPRLGLKAPLRDGNVQEIAKQVVAIAREGLARRGNTNSAGEDESVFLEEVESIVWSGRTPAESLLERFHGTWGGRIDPLFAEEAY